MGTITFALAKGRLAVEAMRLLESVGITCQDMHQKSRKLIFENENLQYKFFLAKATDVPTYVEYGAADCGVVGKDTLLEEGRHLYEALDLGFGKCRIVVAGMPGSADQLKKGNDFRIATKYPNIAADYFYHQKKQTVEIIKLNGSVELGPLVGLADFVVDIVETGSTLAENGLVILEEICPVSARLVVNRASMKMEHKRISQLIGRMKGQ